MPAPKRPKLGNITSKLLYPFPWTDGYPSSQVWADELERLLMFADARGRLQNVPGNFISRIKTDRETQRDAALAELRVGLFLDRNGFPISKWEPAGLGGTTGEYAIRSPEGVEVFVEVKGRGWRSELTTAEIKAGRQLLDKYPDAEGRAVAPWAGIHACIKSAYPKFAPTQPNLLVLADDFFVGILDGEQQQIYIALLEPNPRFDGEPGYFTSAAFENLGGFAAFAGDTTGYNMRVYQNPFALSQTRLPQSLQKVNS